MKNRHKTQKLPHMPWSTRRIQRAPHAHRLLLLLLFRNQPNTKDIKGAWYQAEATGQEERRHLQSDCSVEKALTITSSALPLTDGCYFPETIVGGKDVYLATTYTAVVTFENITKKSGDEVRFGLSSMTDHLLLHL